MGDSGAVMAQLLGEQPPQHTSPKHRQDARALCVALSGSLGESLDVKMSCYISCYISRPFGSVAVNHGPWDGRHGLYAVP